jgi:hypothetical protein
MGCGICTHGHKILCRKVPRFWIILCERLNPLAHLRSLCRLWWRSRSGGRPPPCVAPPPTTPPPRPSGSTSGHPDVALHIIGSGTSISATVCSTGAPPDLHRAGLWRVGDWSEDPQHGRVRDAADRRPHVSGLLPRPPRWGTHYVLMLLNSYFITFFRFSIVNFLSECLCLIYTFRIQQ